MHLYTIAPSLPFLETLAKGVLARFGSDPVALSKVTVLLPTRRAARAFHDALLKANDNRTLLLPKIGTVGDVDEQDELALNDSDILPPIPRMQRVLMLSDIITAWHSKRGDSIALDQALQLAEALARFLDEVQRERLALDQLANIVPDDLAAHWQITLDFLNILSVEWPKKLAAVGAIDPVEHRNQVLTRYAEKLRVAPSQHPLILAGTTASQPATFDVLQAIASQPNGYVVLPGVDTIMSDGEWKTIPNTHPQALLREVLEHLKISRAHLADWHGTSQNKSREAAIARMFYAPETAAADSELYQKGLSGISICEAADIVEEAAVIAVMMREALEEKKTVALVAEEATLIHQVRAQLARWGIDADSSMGGKLTDEPAMVFFILCGNMFAVGATFHDVLACLKHPYAKGTDRPALLKAVHQMEYAVRKDRRDDFQDPRPVALASFFASECWQPMQEAGQTLQHSLQQERANFSDIVEAHLAFAQTLHGGNEWLQGDSGEAVTQFFSQLAQAASAHGTLYTPAYMDVVETPGSGRALSPKLSSSPGC